MLKKVFVIITSTAHLKDYFTSVMITRFRSTDQANRQKSYMIKNKTTLVIKHYCGGIK